MKKHKSIPGIKSEKCLKVSQKSHNSSKTRKQSSESSSNSIADTARSRVHELLSQGQFKKKKCGKHQFLTFRYNKSSSTLIQLSAKFTDTDGKDLFETALFILELESLLTSKSIGFIQSYKETIAVINESEEPLLIFNYDSKEIRRAKLIIVDVDNGKNFSGQLIESLLEIILKISRENLPNRLERMLALNRSAFQKELSAVGEDYSRVVLGGKNLHTGKANLYRLVNHLRMNHAYSPETGLSIKELGPILGPNAKDISEFLRTDRKKYKGVAEAIILRDFTGKKYFLNPSISFE